jgi:glutathionylspermidine synthase
VYNEMVQRVIAGSEAESFFGLTPMQKLMLDLGGSLWHGMARVDLFVTPNGLATTELNSDTPTGQAEACILSKLRATEGLLDPNARMQHAFVAMVKALASASLGEAEAKTVGIIYPTEFTDDLPLVRLYRQWLAEAGFEVVLGSPFNLKAGANDTVELFGKEIHVLWRHYKTDWWGERESAFDDEEIEDRAPLVRELELVARAQLAGRLAVLNPFSAVLPQNKRSMAYFWERIHTFSHAAQETIRAYVPPTFRLETLDSDTVLAEQAAWVLKSDYGAEGDEVIVGKLVSSELFRASLVHARKGRWVAQRYFESERTPEGLIANLGVYLCAGQACGIYGRLDRGVTDDHALSVPVLIRV